MLMRSQQRRLNASMVAMERWMVDASATPSLQSCGGPSGHRTLGGGATAPVSVDEEVDESIAASTVDVDGDRATLDTPGSMRYYSAVKSQCLCAARPCPVRGAFCLGVLQVLHHHASR
jgi:hypothetical protein